MDARRKRFVLALTVFVLWVGALATLALVSGRKPPARAVGAGPDRQAVPR